MKIKFNSYGETFTTGLRVIISDAGEDYDRGQLETLEAKISSHAALFTRLITILYKNDALKKDDIKHLIEGFINVDEIINIEI